MIPILIFTLQKFRELLHRNLVRVTVLLIMVILYGTFSIYLFEHKAAGSDINSLFNSFWFVIQTITTVGYGDLAIVTFWGKANAMIIMLSGIGILGFFTASIASEFIEYSLKSNYGERGVKMKNHIVLCNWNPIAEEIVHEIKEENLEIALLALLEKSPLETLKFVKGTGLHLSDLRKVNINEANSAIVLAETLDDTLASAVDAKSILIIMNIKKLNPSTHVVVELLKSDSVENAKIAGADEILVRGDIIAKLLARGVIDPGTIDIMEIILTARSGEEIYEDDIPAWLEGKKYEDLVKLMLDKNATPIALRSKKGIHVNPSKEYPMDMESVIYIARDRIKF